MKKTILRFLTVFTAVIMLFSFAACNNTDDIKRLNDRINRLERDLAGAKNQEGKNGTDEIDGKDGTDGGNGLDGLSAYEIYKKQRPDYKGSESQWTDDFVNGRLAFSLGLELNLIDNDTAYEVSKGRATGKNIIIPASYNGLPITSIARYGFSTMYDMKSVMIPNSVKIIKDSAFIASGLVSVTIPASVITIEEGAFEACRSLENIFFERGSRLETIGPVVFGSCESLKSITIPANVKNIDLQFEIFSKHNSLVSIEVEEGNTVYRSEQNCLIRIADKMMILGCKTSIIPDSVSAIGSYAFFYCSALENITIPVNVTYIGMYAFRACDGLKSITIHSDITQIKHGAFSSCSSLEEIVFEKNNQLEIISDSLFRNCTKLKNIVIPASVKNVDINAFSACGVLTDVFYGGADASDWNLIVFSEYGGNESLQNATVYYYSEMEIQGRTHWRYVDGIPTVWE